MLSAACWTNVVVRLQGCHSVTIQLMWSVGGMGHRSASGVIPQKGCLPAAQWLDMSPANTKHLLTPLGQYAAKIIQKQAALPRTVGALTSRVTLLAQLRRRGQPLASRALHCFLPCVSLQEWQARGHTRHRDLPNLSGQCCTCKAILIKAQLHARCPLSKRGCDPSGCYPSMTLSMQNACRALQDARQTRGF